MAALRDRLALRDGRDGGGGRVTPGQLSIMAGIDRCGGAGFENVS
ncbi:hypothetical protein [Streptomyces sp. JJ36]|nr:hypothetical protein [Streptomyces sp. JJ36]